MTKVDFIEAIQKLSRLGDVSAQSAAMDAVRKPDDAKEMIRARILVAQADACESLSRKIIELVHGPWPWPK